MTEGCTPPDQRHPLDDSRPLEQAVRILLKCILVFFLFTFNCFVYSASDKDATVILLLFNADPVNITWAVDNDAVDAIMECYYPAQSTGVALYNVLTGVVSPGGRLPYTWPASLDQVMAPYVGS